MPVQRRPPRYLHQGIERIANSALYDDLPLRKDRLSTRVLTLHPGSDDEDVRCTLKVVTINAYSSYEALSYTWGDASDRRAVSVNGRSLMITKNLEEALRALRLPIGFRRIWADAICINQKDLHEREAQVGEMGQIYRSASRVLIWLGAKCQCLGLECDCPPGFDRFQDENLGKLFQRRWWRRVWVIQEVALAATDPLLICGDCSIPWSRLHQHSQSSRHLLELHNMREDVLCPPRLRSLDDPDRFRSLNDPNRLPSLNDSNRLVYRMEDELLVWLVRIVQFEASEPLDKIYAILPLARSGLARRLQVDYSTNANTLMRQLVRHAVRGQQNLDLLVLCQFESSLQDTSWTPNLDAAGLAQLPSTFIGFDEMQRRKNSIDVHWTFFVSNLCNRNLTVGVGPGQLRPSSRDGETLQVQGLMLGTVVRPPVVGGYDMTASCPYHHEISREFERLWKLGATSEYDCRPSEDEGCSARAARLLSQASEDLLVTIFAGADQIFEDDPTVLEYISVVQNAIALSTPSGTVFDRSSWPEKILWWVDGDEHTRDTDEERTRKLLDLRSRCSCYSTTDDAEHSRLLPILRRRSASTGPTTHLENLKRWAQSIARDQDLSRCARRRNCFITDNGLAGIGPSDLRPRDRIFFLLGSKFSFALRDHGEGYRLLGPVYMQAVDVKDYQYPTIRNTKLQHVDDAAFETVIIRSLRSAQL